MRPPVTTIKVSFSPNPHRWTLPDPDDPMLGALTAPLDKLLAEAVTRRLVATSPVLRSIRRKIAKNEKVIASRERTIAKVRRDLARDDAAHEAWRREPLLPMRRRGE